MTYPSDEQWTWIWRCLQYCSLQETTKVSNSVVPAVRFVSLCYSRCFHSTAGSEKHRLERPFRILSLRQGNQPLRDAACAGMKQHYPSLKRDITEQIMSSKLFHVRQVQWHTIMCRFLKQTVTDEYSKERAWGMERVSVTKESVPVSVTSLNDLI